ncbi:uncharacterized protein LOC108737681 [Agrilus planipennis]|uniref:Uncharacterized protein LOC108737681 n=1 Tax=Agrilus planipennis TaxID=224129 RepID=A0A1W4X1D4_AGRPL|nr:uncharacterized protein LOC108737681 [Agrilus planipennis]
MITLGSNEELKFYMQFAKSLVCFLKKPKDRIFASSWITKLQNESFAPLRTRIDFMKLLLVILQKERLLGPFSKDPTDLQTLEQYIGDAKLPDIVKRILKEDVGSLSTLDAIRPPYHIEYSPDLKQYASVQEIPNFGTQLYFAMSSEPLQLWSNMPNKASIRIDKSKPKAKSAIRNIFKTLGNLSDRTKPSSNLFESSFVSSTSWRSQSLIAESRNLTDNAKRSYNNLFEPLGDITSSCSTSTRIPPSWGSQFLIAERGNLRDNNPKRSSKLFESLEDLEDTCNSSSWMPPSSESQFINIESDCSCTECLVSSNSSN